MSNSSYNVTWSTRREANDGFVLEVHKNVWGDVLLRTEYGPMPSHIVPAFITARRRVVAMLAERHGAKPVIEPLDWSILQ